MGAKNLNLFSWFSKTKEEINEIQTLQFNPTLELERNIGKQIYDALQGQVVEELLRKIKISGNDAYWRSAMEGHSLKVEKDLLPDVYQLCQEVKKKLHFEEKVDFYITGDSNVNAFSLSAEDEGEPHIVNINSALFELMSHDELKFVIGHELGHLINKDSALNRLIRFVFPPETNIPISLQYKIRLHNQLAELVADRYGYMAVENLDACVTAFFKMASGLNLEKMNVSISALLADNNRRLEYFLNDKGTSNASHPVNPIRVQALNLYATCKSEEELQKGMDELISILLKVGDGELDEHMAKFIASAGILVANIDDQVSEEEINRILETLANLKVYPRQFLEEILQGDVIEIFNKAIENILNVNPGMREGLLSYMIGIVMADNNISKEEIDFLYSFGANVGFSDKEVANFVASAIQKNYVPPIEAIC